ncbi:MAG TPA: ChaN family lipoprotein, partial [Nitrospira sp.]|nr:ChaN family lipoprotein [Nitrospira sp.]
MVPIMLGRAIPVGRALYMSFANKILRILFMFCSCLALGACAEDGLSRVRSAAGITPAEIREGQIIDTTTGRSVSIDQMMERLGRQEVVYVGEEHHNEFHIKNTLSLLNRLTSESRRPMLAMEMFGWESQSLIDRYLG